MTKTEDVLVISRRQLPGQWTERTVSFPAVQDLGSYFRLLPFSFMPRNRVESDCSFKQLIPYIIVLWENKIALYQRAGSEKRLSGLWSAGIGGHINNFDTKDSELLIDIFFAGAKRELFEEFAIDDSHHAGFDFLGIINEELTDVGKVHLGIVLLCSIESKAEPGAELFNLQWINPGQVKNFEIELWTELALKLYSKYTSSVNDRPLPTTHFNG